MRGTFFVFFSTSIEQIVYYNFTIPILKIKGERIVEINVFADYKDEGYELNHPNKDLKVHVDSSVNTEKVGIYDVIYSVNHLDDKLTKTRKVKVVDNEKPTIELIGSDEILLLDLERVKEILPDYIHKTNKENKPLTESLNYLLEEEIKYKDNRAAEGIIKSANFPFRKTLEDLRSVGCDILTIGQYIQPSKQHLEVSKFYTLEEFEELKTLAKEVGFKNYQIGPLVRSSYKASEIGGN